MGTTQTINPEVFREYDVAASWVVILTPTSFTGWEGPSPP
jgi:hypothetical protein